MECYLGIDFGTSGARAIAITPTQQICAQTSARFPPSSPSHWARDWQAMLKQLITDLPTDCRQSMRAIAINGTSSTVMLCDGQGNPLDPPILYNDARGVTEVESLRTQLTADEPGRDTVLSATSSLVKLLWWRHQPCFAEARYFLHQADWLAFLLHGQAGISDYHNALKLGYDVVHLHYPDWLQRHAIAPLLPQVVPPGTPLGLARTSFAAELGLSADCQVCAGTTDSIAAFLASGATQPGEAVTSLGSTLVLKLLSQVRVENGVYGIYSHRLGDLWLVGGASNTGGAVLQQFFTSTELEDLSSRIPVEQASPLDYYPLVQPGERFPINQPDLPPKLEPRPCDRTEFLHGLLESMARIEARGYHLLQEFGATPLHRVYTAGGGATNPAWTRIRARQLNVPVLPSQYTEAAYGTALLALRGSTSAHRLNPQ